MEQSLSEYEQRSSETTQHEKELETRINDLQLLVGVPIWVGTESLQTLDRTVHALTPTTLTQIYVTEGSSDWKTAFTFPIEDGEWELKIRFTGQSENALLIDFLKHPLPGKATQTIFWKLFWWNWWCFLSMGWKNVERRRIQASSNKQEVRSNWEDSSDSSEHEEERSSTVCLAISTGFDSLLMTREQSESFSCSYIC